MINSVVLGVASDAVGPQSIPAELMWHYVDCAIALTCVVVFLWWSRESMQASLSLSASGAQNSEDAEQLSQKHAALLAELSAQSHCQMTAEFEEMQEAQRQELIRSQSENLFRNVQALQEDLVGELEKELQAECALSVEGYPLPPRVQRQGEAQEVRGEQPETCYLKSMHDLNEHPQWVHDWRAERLIEQQDEEAQKSEALSELAKELLDDEAEFYKSCHHDLNDEIEAEFEAQLEADLAY